MTIDPETGYNEEYDEALQFCIEEIIDQIHLIKDLDSLAVESVYYTMFKKDIEQRWQEYIEECKV